MKLSIEEHFIVKVLFHKTEINTDEINELDLEKIIKILSSNLIIPLFYNNLKFLDLDISNISTSEIIIYSLIISLFSQIGDLSVSFFKRKAKIKNTGNLIPGHGGLLDRIDGMIFAFPYTLILLKIV